MKKVILLAILGLSTTTFGQFTNTTGETGVPYSEVTHEKVSGALTTVSGVVMEGKISYNEYGNEEVYLYQEGKDPIHFETTDSIQSMVIAGRGIFESVSLYNPESKTLALVLEETDAYKVYQKCSVGQGILGYKISGGMMEGRYLTFVYHKRKNTMISKDNVKKIEKTIGEYIDYCDEITSLVQNEKKGYKVTLIFRDFDVLKKAILESATTCPE
jgi:hypothetical protein